MRFTRRALLGWIPLAAAVAPETQGESQPSGWEVTVQLHVKGEHCESHFPSVEELTRIIKRRPGAQLVAVGSRIERSDEATVTYPLATLEAALADRVLAFTGLHPFGYLISFEFKKV